MLVSLRDDLLTVNRSLTEAESTRDRDRKDEQLECALRSSLRAIEGLLRESELAVTLTKAGEVASPYQDAIQQTWEDAMLFQAFLAAERRLFHDLGLDSSTTDRLIAAMRSTQAEFDWRLPGASEVDDALRALTSELQTALDQLSKEDDRRAIFRLVGRGFFVVGGAFVVGANALAGAATAPVTGGLSVAGAAVSASVGGVMIDRGLPS